MGPGIKFCKVGIVLLGGGFANFELLEFLAFELKNKAFAHFGPRLFCCCVYWRLVILTFHGSTIKCCSDSCYSKLLVLRNDFDAFK